MRPDERTLVVVPTDAEAQRLVDGLSEGGATATRATHGRPAGFNLEALGLVVAPGGLGKTQFAVHTAHLLAVAPWRLVICAGTAGALSDDVAIGDVVIGTESVEHDIRKVGRPLVPRFATDAALLESCRAALDSATSVRVHFGPIASGDEDIVSEARRSELHPATGAIAVAWEGAGGARACQLSDVRYVEIRGIADAANTNGPRDFAANLDRTMRNVATTVARIAHLRL